MNNNTNENLNQTQTNTNANNLSVSTSNVGNDQSIQAVSQDVTSVMGNVQTQPDQVTSKEPVSVNENVQIQSSNQEQQAQPVIEQRVNLVQKPVMHGVVPNKEVTPSESQEKNVEVLDEVTNSSNNVNNSSKNDGNYGFKAFFLIVLFGGLLAVVFYLPEISNYIETKKYLQTHVDEKITTGILKCKYEDSSETLDYNYALDFYFTDNKLNKLSYLLEIRGDANLDEGSLKEYKAECDQISKNVEKLNGITISCALSNGLYKQKQTLNYASIDVEAVMSAYTEAGGIYPDYENGENVDDIEKNMNASGYTCERIK